MTHSVQFGAQIATRSPGAMPLRDERTCRARRPRSPSSAKVRRASFVDEGFAGAELLGGPGDEARYGLRADVRSCRSNTYVPRPGRGCA